MRLTNAMKKKFIYIILSIFILSACSINPPISDTNKTQIQAEIKEAPKEQNIIAEPIKNALTRVTKKPFGMEISPKNSPVNPEKFSGYHTGTDFETSSDEQELDVDIYTICEGPLILKRYTTGYGGVAVQRCVVQNNDVTIIYGHLKLSSIVAPLNRTLIRGQKIGILGKGYSKETDGERKHLHLGIHKGKSVSLLGYVQNESLLSDWIDPIPLIKTSI